MTLVGLDGAFVEVRDGTLCQLQESYDENECQASSNAHLRNLMMHSTRQLGSVEGTRTVGSAQRKQEDIFGEEQSQRGFWKGYCQLLPGGRPAEDGVLVVRTDALRNFEQSIIGAPASVDKPMTTDGTKHTANHHRGTLRLFRNQTRATGSSQSDSQVD